LKALYSTHTGQTDGKNCL